MTSERSSAQAACAISAHAAGAEHAHSAGTATSAGTRAPGESGASSGGGLVWDQRWRRVPSRTSIGTDRTSSTTAQRVIQVHGMYVPCLVFGSPAGPSAFLSWDWRP